MRLSDICPNMKLLKKRLFIPLTCTWEEKKAVRDNAIKEERNLEEELKNIEDTKGSNPSFNKIVEDFYKKLLDHMKFEESNVFPLLDQRLDREHSDAMVDVMEDMKKLAPTRPHPKAPTNSGTLATLAPLVAFLDRLRDVGRKYPEDMKDEPKDTPYESTT